MPRGGDEFGIGVLIMAACVILLSMGLGLFKAIIENPWLIAVCIAAGLIYVLARREEKRERGNLGQPRDRKPPSA